MYRLQHSKKEIGRAGERLVVSAKDSTPYDDIDINILHSWRMAHLYPLQQIEFYLEREALKINPKVITSSRIRRTPSIITKLIRFPGMKLHKMQDLGGCRAILANVDEVYKLDREIQNLKFQHQLIRVDDYMKDVKPSGYRSMHLVYAFNNKKYPELNGLRIEIQVRTTIQHSWATAVEMVGLFRRESLKSSLGDESWLRFFRLVSDLFHMIDSNNVGHYHQTSDEIKALAKKLRVFEVLDAYNQVVQHIENDIKTDSGVYVILLDTEKRWVKIDNFKNQNFKAAADAYIQAEKYCIKNDSCEVAMVSVNDISQLKNAYPAYFLDTKTFLNNIRRFVF
ncbi:RelA/SpoT domain-containing protein [Aeromonas veronii]|uniref:RelA/SpoT domain-containing protein n=1 Tax=Aeromonas veronii TaxID=654 RepID=UPI003006F69F